MKYIDRLIFAHLLEGGRTHVDRSLMSREMRDHWAETYEARFLGDGYGDRLMSHHALHVFLEINERD